jgi:hypothetical protein
MIILPPIAKKKNLSMNLITLKSRDQPFPCRDDFSYFTLQNSYPRGTEGVGSSFHILRSQNHFRPYQGRQIQFSYFALSNSFLAVSRESTPTFVFCAPGLVFGCTDGVGSTFHVLRSQTHFRQSCGRWVQFSYFPLLYLFQRYQWCWVQFSCFTLPESF